MAGGRGRTIRVLNVAEKPSVAKAVSGILSKNQPGGMRVRDGRSRYNKIFEFNYTIRNQPCQMLFTSVTGHLMELEFDDRYRKWHSCDPVDLYNAPVRKYVPEEIDLRIGASFTRFQTMLLRNAFVLDVAMDDRNVVLSYGPCQFPTLGFVVERYWEIQAHEPEEFWTINCTHNSDEGIATFNWMRGHLFDYSCGVIIYEMCIQEPTATVTKVKQQEKLKYPPHPLSTIELEKRASRYFRMSSEQTMKRLPKAVLHFEGVTHKPMPQTGLEFSGDKNPESTNLSGVDKRLHMARKNSDHSSKDLSKR
ncbi:hypothetical protein FXO38_31958 [Capsicum annuum]|nr:hypothetical protein FXO38_31958 [Capsicum annuum]KAF3650140.1 hypothetical protein FXO37_18604 [Capsicum annuum]